MAAEMFTTEMFTTEMFTTEVFTTEVFTTEMSTSEIGVADLGDLGAELGKGGQAIVYDAPELILPDAPGPLVYKRFRPGMEPRVYDTERLVGLRINLDAAVRTRLDRIAAWPLRLVMDGGNLCGLVLPRIPESYFQPVTLPSGRPGRWVREIQHLFVDPARCRRVGMPEVSWQDRAVICRDLAEALHFLHGPEIGVVFGDINPKNELFRLDDEPRVMFVDCDAVRPIGQVTGAPQLNAPDWEPPNETSLNRQTDIYKLGLFVLRCLTPPGEQASTRRDPEGASDVLDAAGMDLLRATLAGPPTGRPDAGEWLRYLSRLMGEPLDPPALDELRLDRTLVAAGEPVTLTWATTDAITVEVAAPGVPVVVSDARSGSGTTQICPARTGTLTITARNTVGVATDRTPPVAVFDLPDWTDLPVPMPELSLTDVDLPGMPDVRPVLALGVPAPVLELPPLTGVTAATGPPMTFDVLPRPPLTAPGIDVSDPGPVDVVSIMMPDPTEGRAR